MVSEVDPLLQTESKCTRTGTSTSSRRKFLESQPRTFLLQLVSVTTACILTIAVLIVAAVRVFPAMQAPAVSLRFFLRPGNGKVAALCVAKDSKWTKEADARSSTLPKMIVFDLDATLWLPEMYELNACPSEPIFGVLGLDCNGSEEVGILGLKVPPDGPVVSLFPEALYVLRRIHLDPAFRNVKIAAASTSEEPEYSFATLSGLEIFRGMSMASMFDYLEIGRTGALTKYKTSHFELLAKQSGVSYDDMLFFDDCYWEDHVQDMYDAFGVIGQRTPDGLNMETFLMGLQRYRKSKFV